jgi:hypothetical protein
MKLILYPLLILIFVGAFWMLVANNTLNYSTYYNNAFEASGNQTLSGTTSTLTQQNTNVAFGIDMTTGLVILIVSMVIIGTVAGVRVLGSGLSNFAVVLIYKSAVYWGLWGMFSAFSITAFMSIPTFGVFIWFLLTLIYTLGFFQTLNGGGGGEDD